MNACIRYILGVKDAKSSVTNLVMSFERKLFPLTPINFPILLPPPHCLAKFPIPLILMDSGLGSTFLPPFKKRVMITAKVEVKAEFIQFKPKFYLNKRYDM